MGHCNFPEVDFELNVTKIILWEDFVTYWQYHTRPSLKTKWGIGIKTADMVAGTGQNGNNYNWKLLNASCKSQPGLEVYVWR